MRKIKRKNNQIKNIMLSNFLLLFLITIGYSAFQTNIKLNTKGNIKIDEQCFIGNTWEYNYKNESQEFKTPCTGKYKIELWGAGGNSTTFNSIIFPGNGGYVKGNIILKRNKILYVYVGDSETKSGHTHYNGGGGGEAPGGGATDIRIDDGVWDEFNSLKSRIMVAGGGGGGFYSNTSNHKPGHAGGLLGYDADAYYPANSETSLSEREYSGHGATQTTFGISGKISARNPFNNIGYQVINASFGSGGTSTDENNSAHSSGGGSGYYGGGHGVHQGNTWSGGGGGSSFISGHDGCDAIDEDSTQDNIIHTGQSIHYSGLYFTDTLMIDGAGYKWTNVKLEDEVVGMPTHDGTSTMIGNSGNGYVKITLISRE